MKHGAWNPCPKCRHHPESPEDRARHVITSDHYFSVPDLERVSADIQAGKQIRFDEDQVKELAADIPAIVSGAKKQCIVLALVLAAAIAGVVLLVKYLLR
jgi:hypothetical protein